MTPGQRLATLQRRLGYLQERIAGGLGSPAALGRYHQEAGALSWAIEALEPMVAVGATEARDVRRQRVEACWRTTAASAVHRLRQAGLPEPVPSSPEVVKGIEGVLAMWATQAVYGVGKLPRADDTRRAG